MLAREACFYFGVVAVGALVVAAGVAGDVADVAGVATAVAVAVAAAFAVVAAAGLAAVPSRRFVFGNDFSKERAKKT